MMDRNQLKEIKETFKSLEQMLSQASSAANLVNSTPGFAELLSKAYKCLGLLEKEWILEEPKAFNSRDAIRSVVEGINSVQYGVKNGFETAADDSLQTRLNEAKAILCAVNEHLNNRKITGMSR